MSHGQYEDGHELTCLGIRAELYPDTAKMKKQMSYADRKGIPMVLMIGENEINENTFVLKKMIDGSQNTYEISDLSKVFGK